MGNKKKTAYMVNNEKEFISTNIALGNECCHLEEENKRLKKEIEKVEKKIIEKIDKANKKRGFAMVMLNPKTGRS